MELIKELKKVMQEGGLSAEQASHYIGCSAKTVFRWLYGESIPHLAFQRLIREGIDKIKETFPKKENIRPHLQSLNVFCIDNLSLLQEKEKDFWEEVISKMTINERGDIFHTGSDRKIMEKKISKAAKRLNISQPGTYRE